MYAIKTNLRYHDHALDGYRRACRSANDTSRAGGGSYAAEHHQNDENDENRSDNADATVPIAIAIAAKSAAESSDQKDDQQDQKK